MIAAFGIADHLDARWPNLSQGERGRVLIARALMPEPKLLLLDEPSTGLDLAAREQLLTALDQVRRENPRLASVLVTHHIEEIPASTTHAILIRRGQVLAQGPIGEVLTSVRISECFEHGIEISAHHGRWAARALASV